MAFSNPRGVNYSPSLLIRYCLSSSIQLEPSIFFHIPTAHVTHVLLATTLEILPSPPSHFTF